ncbi:MAG: cell division protein ZapD [Coxiella endosymbiont of Haemaphysalis qinghaiensis]
MTKETITYEHPLNELVRICLRLEHLFHQLYTHLNASTSGGSHLAMLALLKALNVIDRPDLKSKLTQALAQQVSILAQLKHLSQIDRYKLQKLLTTLDQHINQLHQTPGKIAETLRKNTFLSQIRAHLHNPAGPCNFTAPAYALWLRQPSEDRVADLQNWAGEFKSLSLIINTILQVTRESTSPQNIVTQGGFYQQTLNANSPCQLIQLTLPIKKNVYPEISAGKYRLVIRFLSLLNVKGNSSSAKSISENISFMLNCCKI